MGVSCFTGNRLLSLRPNRSSVASTGRNREPLGQNVESGIGVTVVNHATCRTDPFPYVQGKQVEYMLACATRFRGWVEPIDLDQSTSVPLGFVVELTDKFTPSRVTDSFCKLGILDHVLDCQALHTYHFVFVFRSLLLGMPSLSVCQFLLIFGEVAGIANAFSSREDDHRLDAQVKPDHLGTDRKRLDLFLDQDGDKVAVGTIFSDRDRTWLAAFWQRPMPDNLQRGIHLGKGEGLAIPRERIGGIGSQLLMLLFLEGGVCSTSLKEVHKGAVQMAKGLLDGNRGNISKPGILLLEIREHGRQIGIREALFMLEIGRFTGREAPIVDKADTSERLSEMDSLLIGRIEAIFVCPRGLPAHTLHAFLISFDVLFQSGCVVLQSPSSAPRCEQGSGWRVI